MMAVRSLLSYCFCIYLIQCSRSKSFVDITRRTDGDLFTNPASKCDVCEETVRKSYELYNNINTGGKCASLENCCRQCACSKERATYLKHENRCISNQNLTAILFHDVKQGCSNRLVPNNYFERGPRGAQTCLFTNLRLPALNTSVRGSQKIEICGIYSWSVSSCSVLSGAYYSNGQWMDLWDAGSEQDIFSVKKRQGVYLKWNDTLPSSYHGYILSLDIQCNRKYNRSPVESCLLFKVKGTQIAIRPSTIPPTNSTATPTNVESRGKQKSADKTVTIIISVVCALIVLVLICVVTLCIRKRGGLCNKKKYSREKREKNLHRQQTPGKVTIGSPATKNEVKECQCLNQVEGPVYTTPATDKVAYQNLLQAIATPHYQPLVAKDNKETPRSSSPPFYHEPEKPGNKPGNSDVTPHVYHVLEGP